MSAPLLPLRQVCSIEKGGLNPQVYAEECFAHYSIPAFDDGSKPALEHGMQIKSQKTVISRGTVLVSKLNPRIPRVWYVADELPFRRICSTEFVPFKPDTSRLSPEYLAFALRQLLTGGQITGSTSAATKSRERAKPGDIAALLIPVPALDEQHRIVDLLSRAEGIVRLRRRAQQKAAELIPAIFVDMFGDPATNPNRWPLHQLADLLADTKLGLVRGAKEMGSGLAYPYLRMDAVGSGYVQLRGLRRVDASPKEVADSSLKEGDFLFNTRNSRELVGKTGVVAAEPPERTLFNNNLMRMRFHEDVVLPLFVNWQFQTEHVQRQLDSIKRGTTTVFAVYYKDLKNLQLVVPAIDRQRQFSERATQILRIQQHQREATEKAESAFGALLARSFGGAAAPAGVPSEEATEA